MIACFVDPALVLLDIVLFLDETPNI
jgi:hypothetical protein